MSSIKKFNALSKGRCKDKMLAMKHLCELSDLQYEILCLKWCSGRRGYTREEIANRCNISTRTVDREYADAVVKIISIIKEYNQENYEGNFFFELDEKMTGYDWSKHTKV